MLELCFLNGRFFSFFRDCMRRYHDLLKIRTSFLFMLEGWGSIWVTFLWSSPCIMIWQRVISVFKLDKKTLWWRCAVHHNHFQDITILSTKSKNMDWIIREAIQTQLHPSNMKRDIGHVFVRSQKPPLPHRRTDETCLLITNQHGSITQKALIFILPYWLA